MKKKNRIIGLVSNRYVSYSNRKFLDDIEKLLLDDDKALMFAEAHIVNTHLYVRFLTEKVFGYVKGIGGVTKDRTLLGLQFQNSMVGDSAVTGSYFLQRLVCANGLILPAGELQGRVFHSGKWENFEKRLKLMYQMLTSGLREKAKYVEQLGVINFSPEKLAAYNAFNLVMDIIPRCRSTIQKKYRYTLYSFRKLYREERIGKEALAISHIPETFAGALSANVFKSKYRDNATMFDFINVFTEYANERPVAELISIQEKAGALADWIIKNKDYF